MIGINFGRFTIDGYNGTAWQTLATVDARLDAGNLTGSGDSVRPASATGSTTYVEAGEFAGSCIEWGANAYRIADHSAGVLGTSGTARIAEFILDGLDTATATNAGKIVPRDVAVRIDLLGSHYSGWRISINAQDTPEGYFEIGLLHFARVEVFGTPPAFGWQPTTEANTTTETTNLLQKHLCPGLVGMEERGATFHDNFQKHISLHV